MREIKFRSWDPLTHKMFKSFNLEWLKHNSKTPDDFTKRALFDDALLFMQYTGLKDKNGKEIYEGDILVAEYGRRSSIEYDAPHFIIRHHPEGGSDFIAAKNKFEVIGNIYENPELLK